MSRLPFPFNQSLFQRLWSHLATREYCEWASPYLAYLRSPLAVLSITAIAALLCGLFVAPQGFAIFAAIASVIVIGCIWPWIGIYGISCQLQFSAPRTEEGKAVDMILVMTNRWPWPVWGLAIEDGLPQTDGEGQTKIAVSRIAGWSRSHFRRPFVPALRGRYPTQKPILATEFPFGLWKGRRPIEVTSPLLVWPERFALPPIAIHSGTQSWTGQPCESATGSVGHRTAVREYRRGDSIRQIHWAKTALYDKLVAYEREGTAISEAIVSLDTHATMHKESDNQSSIDWTVRIAASISNTLLEQGVNLTVLSHTDRFRAISRSSDLTKLMDWFALLSVSEESHSNSRVRSQNARFGSGMTIHITTDRSNLVAGDSIVFLTDSEGPSPAHKNRMLGCWFTVNRNLDIPSQMRSGWQNGPRSIRHAV